MNRIRFILALILVAVANLQGIAQQTIYPVTATVVLNPPNTAILTDYYSPGSDKLAITMTFNDLSEPSWDVRLRITIESGSIRIVTKDNIVPPTPITLYPGQPVTVSGEELEPYLTYSNINIAGISLADLQKDGVLPEGFYTFRVEVLDYRSGRVISNVAMAGAFLRLNGVPIVQLPHRGDVLPVSQPQNILFQWQLSTPVFYGNPNDIEYSLSLYKVLDESVEPQNSIQNNVVEQIYSSPYSNNTTLVYDASCPPLEVGRLYSFTVTARDVQGRSVFKNNGVSEVYWFRYGYPEGGHISIVSPSNDYTFTAEEFKRFKWNAPDNLVQNEEVSYHVKIVELQDNQDTAEAIQNNTPFYEYESPSSYGTAGGEFILNQELEPLKTYAWKIEAFSGDQKIAESPVYEFNGPPVIEWFWGGNQKVAVVKTFNDDLSSLSGIGKIKMSDSSDLYMRFDSINIVNSGGEYVLANGFLYNDSLGIDSIELDPENSVNGKAYFYPERLRLDKNSMRIYGHVEWNFPHIVNSPGVAKVKSREDWLTYDGFKLSGSIKLSADNRFELMDPSGFVLDLDTISDFLVFDNRYRARLYGKFELPQNVKDADNNIVSIGFSNKDNLYYFTVSSPSVSAPIAPVRNTGLFLSPTSVTVDLSENESPGRFSQDKSWKGIYFDEFDFGMSTQGETSGQIVPDNVLSTHFNLANDNTENCWVTSSGLDLNLHYNFGTDASCKFYDFNSNLTEANIEIQNSALQSGELKGFIKVPFLSDDDSLFYTLPMSVDGFLHGYLDDEYQHFTVDLNPDKEKLHVILNIKRAVFTQNDRLELTTDIEWPAMQCIATDVSGLTIWGDQSIGFGTPNGTKVLDEQIKGMYEGTYEVTIDSIFASRYFNDYMIGFSGSIALSDDITGDNGPPRFNVGAIKSLQQEDLPPIRIEPSISIKDLMTTAKDMFNEDEINIAVPYVYIATPAVILFGQLGIVHNNPDWGTAFYGYCNGHLRKPKRINIEATLVIGNKEGTNYWFAELAFNKDHSGQGPEIPKVGMSMGALHDLGMEGIEVGPMVISSIVGRVYHHMKPKTSVGVDCHMDFTEINDPGDLHFDFDMSSLDINFPDLDFDWPDLDFCGALDRLTADQKKEVFHSLPEMSQLQILREIDPPDFNSIVSFIRQNYPEYEDRLNQVVYSHSVAPDDVYTYDRWKTLFPEIDWISKAVDDEDQGFQWSDLCHLHFQWPSLPSLCELSSYLLNKVLGELPPPDYNVLENLKPDVDWGVIQAKYPDVTWPNLREFFPDGDLCHIVMVYPGIDWGYIYLHVPGLPHFTFPPDIDWRKILFSFDFWPDLFPDFDFSLNMPDMPDMGFELNDLKATFDIDPSISYGTYLFVKVKSKDFGFSFKGEGSFEINFSESGGVNNFGLQLSGSSGNIPGGKISPLSRELGCLSYTEENNTFTGDFFAEVHKSTALCAHGNLHFDISDNDFNLNLGTRETPVVVQPGCLLGLTRYEGYLGVTSSNIQLYLGFHTGLHLALNFTPVSGCTLGLDAKAGYYANVFADIYYNPDFYVNEATLNAGMYASIKVTSSGSVCGDHEFTIASASLDGTLSYKNSPHPNISGSLSGEATFLDVVTTSFTFNVNQDL